MRGRAKVSTQWRLYCLVHNIEKARPITVINEPAVRCHEAAKGLAKFTRAVRMHGGDKRDKKTKTQEGLHR